MYDKTESNENNLTKIATHTHTHTRCHPIYGRQFYVHVKMVIDTMKPSTQ